MTSRRGPLTRAFDLLLILGVAIAIILAVRYTRPEGVEEETAEPIAPREAPAKTPPGVPDDELSREGAPR